MRKNILIVLTAAALVSAFAITSSAKGGGYSVKVYYEGDAIVFDTAPEIINDRTFVPLRAIAETLGAEVEWDGATETVTLARDGVTTTLAIGSTNTKTIASEKSFSGSLEAAPYIKDARTMVPLRFISETFGMNVSWNGNLHHVYITSPASLLTVTDVPTAEPTTEPTAEPTAEPSEEPLQGPLSDEARYASMYDGTEYEFVRNLPMLTNDFEVDESKYRSGKHWGNGKDADSNGVMYVVKNVNKKEARSEYKLTLDRGNEYNKDECIDISFDLYVPTSPVNVTASLVDSNEDDACIFQLMTHLHTGLYFKYLSAIDFPLGVYEDYSPSLYFNNNNNEDIAIRNGAHINIFINPYRGKMYTTISNNSNDAEPISMSGNIAQASKVTHSKELEQFGATRFRLYGLKISAQFNENTKDIIFDNLITNIVKKRSSDAK